MQPNKTKLALQIGTVILGAAYASNVLAAPFNATVNTIADVTIAQLGTNAMDFGTAVLPDAGTTCILNAVQPLDTDVFSDGAATAATAYAGLTGGGCTGTGTPGIYVISGENSVDVTVTVSTEAQTGNYTFVPGLGCGVNHNGTTGADSCSLLDASGPVTLTTAGGTDDAATNFGETHFTMGGTITVTAGGLTPDTDYFPTFLVNVVY